MHTVVRCSIGSVQLSSDSFLQCNFNYTLHVASCANEQINSRRYVVIFVVFVVLADSHSSFSFHIELNCKNYSNIFAFRTLTSSERYTCVCMSA